MLFSVLLFSLVSGCSLAQSAAWSSMVGGGALRGAERLKKKVCSAWATILKKGSDLAAVQMYT